MRYVLLSFYFLLSYSLIGQYTIRGYAVDKATGKPVPFASAFLEADQSYGVLTNEKGQYVLRLDSNQYATQTLVFTSLSYRAERVRLRDIELSSAGEGYLNVQLETEFVALPEVVVLSDLGIRALMKRVIARISENYGAEKYLLKAYHRSYFADDTDFAQLNEAYLVIEDGPYTNEKRNDRVWVNQFRNPKAPAGVPPHIAKFFGNQNILAGPYYWQSNPLRNHWIWMFQGENALEYLTFRQTGEFLHGTDTLLRIQYEIDPKKSQEKGWVGDAGHQFAEILINKTDLAVLSFRYWTKSESIYQDATYQKVDGKYYFQRGSFSWAIDSDFYVFPRLFSNFLFVTEVVTDPAAMKQVRKGKRLRGDEPLTDLNLRYLPEYWQGEERLLQLPADETVRLQLQEIMELDVPVDTVGQDSFK